MKTDLQRAYEDWVDQAPEKGGSCCSRPHFGVGRSMGEAKADDSVCSREYTWRKYVRIRDENSNWPFLGFKETIQ